jgi:tRNA-binding EMAP/Myf-like protein
MELVYASGNTGPQIRVTPSAAAGEGKKADDGTTTSPRKYNMVADVDSPETQTLTPAKTTGQNSGAMICLSGRIGGSEKLYTFDRFTAEPPGVP